MAKALKPRREVVAQTTKCSHREAVGVGLAYMRINKMSLYDLFCALRKHSGLYRTVQVVKYF